MWIFAVGDMSLCNYFQLPLAWKQQKVKYHALALSSIRLFCEAGLAAFLDQMGHTASSLAQSSLHSPAAFFRAWLDQFSVFTSNTVDLLMHRTSPGARAVLCVQFATRVRQKKFCTFQQDRLMPHSSGEREQLGRGYWLQNTFCSLV